MTRVAAFDCGTNSLRLLIADLDPQVGGETELVREMRVVRLGAGVDRTGRISAESLDRTVAALREYAAMLEVHQPERIRFCATSAARDAENAAEFSAAVRSAVGVEPEVLDGLEEARASFAGAVRAVPGAAEPILVLDIGGGSTELILGGRDQSVAAAQSLDIGSVRLTERHLHQDPPTHDQIAAVCADVDAALDQCPVDPAAAHSVVAVAGTATTLAAAALDLPAYDRSAVHLARLTVAEVARVAERIVAMPVAQRRALGFMHPGRADVIGAGALILQRVLARVEVEAITISESDILDGIAWGALHR